MAIRNHRVAGAAYVESPNRGGTIKPKFIVQHYTVGYTAESAINTLSNPRSKASAHVVIGLDGEITQMVPFNKKAWHAGPSHYQGYSGLNNSSIGIEIVNIGWLRPLRNGQLQDSYGNIRKESDFPNGLIESAHSRVGGGVFLWPVYPEVQLRATESLTRELIEEYKILDVVSHEEIDTRGWKTDPGPAFPMRRFKSLLPERGEESDKFEVTASKLNVRGGPGTRFEAIGTLDKGNIVKVEAVNGNWARIDDNGWVHTGFLRRV